MQEIDLLSLDSGQQIHVKKARRAIDYGHHSYAVDICRQILWREPGCLPVRKILRNAQKAGASSGYPNWRKFFKTITTFPGFIRCQIWLSRNPKKSLYLAEKLLTRDPFNVRANLFLANAAESLGLSETVVFAREEIRGCQPRNVSNLMKLGITYLALGRHTEAEKTGDLILQFDPMDETARALVKSSSVRRTIEKSDFSQ